MDKSELPTPLKGIINGLRASCENLAFVHFNVQYLNADKIYQIKPKNRTVNKSISPSDSGGRDLCSHFLCSDCKGENWEPGAQLLRRKFSHLLCRGNCPCRVCSRVLHWVKSPVARGSSVVLSGLQCGKCPDPSFPHSIAKPLVKFCLLLLLLLPSEHYSPSTSTV